MAIVQISRITNRKGLQVDLPQLAGAELGWSVDERRLFIGNGTLEEGAPVVGNTEILTEFSDILEFQTNYTYKGTAAGYQVQTGPTPGDPVTQSLQSWLDQFATVKDFGAVGDGIADDTEAINRALYQIFCREVNPQIRRSLFFPAGVYRVTSAILIPPYATLYGEGLDNSIITLDNDTASSYVARTADSLQQYGVNIGLNSATPPQHITIANMGFENLDPDLDVFLVEDAVNCRFQNVGFFGPLTTGDLNTETNFTKCVAFASTSSLVCEQIVFDGCRFSGTTYGIATDQQTKGITINNSFFKTLYKGVNLGTNPVVNGGPTGFRILQSVFDTVYAEGVVFGDVSLNATGYNAFYDVGNHFGGALTPYTAIIDIQTSNNLSVGDMFERSDAYSYTINAGTAYPRITLNDTQSIATTNGVTTQQGTYARESGDSAILADNTVSPTTIFSVNTESYLAFSVNYTIIRDTGIRTGTLFVTSANGETLNWFDDYTENTDIGISISVSQPSTLVNVQYTSTSASAIGTMNYSITHLA